jgi:hypothetical protein
MFAACFLHIAISFFWLLFRHGEFPLSYSEWWWCGGGRSPHPQPFNINIGKYQPFLTCVLYTVLCDPFCNFLTQHQQEVEDRTAA